MQTINKMPSDGQVIVFTKTPPCSYCSPGEAYRVSRGTVRKAGKKVLSKYFHFERVNGGSATIDPAWAVSQSEWRVA